MKLNFTLWTNVDDTAGLWTTYLPCRGSCGCPGAHYGQGVGPRHARHARAQAGAARGCAWLRSRRQAAPPLPSAVRRGDPEGVGTKGVPPHRRQEGLPARRRTKGGGRKKPRGDRSLADPGRSMARKRVRSAVQRPQRVSPTPTTDQEADSPQRVGCVCGLVTGRHSAAVIARLPRSMEPSAAVTHCNALRNALQWV